MLRDKTTLILGAGASVDAKMPLGDILAEQIANITDITFDYRWQVSDHRFYDILRTAFPDQAELHNHFRVCAKISGGVRLRRSIDSYVDSNSAEVKIATCAKLAITELILRAERNSPLFNEDLHNAKFDRKKLGNTWYDEFANITFQSVPLNKIPEELEKLRVISFNYDRCFQQAMALWISTAYHISLLESYDLVRKIRVIFPYGTVGSLPNAQGHDGLHFGTQPFTDSMKEISNLVRTYSESAVDEESNNSLTEAYGFGKITLFLGCAYHPQNLKLLRSQMPSFERLVLGTAMNISDDGCYQIAESLIESYFVMSDRVAERASTVKHVFGNQVRLHTEFDCLGLLRNYRQALIN